MPGIRESRLTQAFNDAVVVARNLREFADDILGWQVLQGQLVPYFVLDRELLLAG